MRVNENQDRRLLVITNAHLLQKCANRQLYILTFTLSFGYTTNLHIARKKKEKERTQTNKGTSERKNKNKYYQKNIKKY